MWKLRGHVWFEKVLGRRREVRGGKGCSGARAGLDGVCWLGVMLSYGGGGGGVVGLEVGDFPCGVLGGWWMGTAWGVGIEIWDFGSQVGRMEEERGGAE